MRLRHQLGLLIVLTLASCLSTGRKDFISAEALWNAGEYANAAVVYSDAISSGKLSKEELIISHYNIATFLFMNFQLAETLKELNIVLQQRSDHIEAYGLRANVSDILGNDEQALADWNKLLELNPNDAIVYNDRSYFYAARGQLEKAIAEMEMYLKLRPNSAEQLRQLGHLKTKWLIQNENIK